MLYGGSKPLSKVLSDAALVLLTCHFSSIYGYEHAFACVPLNAAVNRWLLCISDCESITFVIAKKTEQSDRTIVAFCTFL